eukprot:scaffold282388_cov27-Tisochrysis_lutea.AAC.3
MSQGVLMEHEKMPHTRHRMNYWNTICFTSAPLGRPSRGGKTGSQLATSHEHESWPLERSGRILLVGGGGGIRGGRGNPIGPLELFRPTPARFVGRWAVEEPTLPVFPSSGCVEMSIFSRGRRSTSSQAG